MRTDPRAACANTKERKGWAILHDAVCHPLMALSNWSKWSVRFHDWTSVHAWPRAVVAVGERMHLPSRHHGVLVVRRVAAGIYSVQHPTIRHALVTSAADGIAAVEVAEVWFDSLRDVGIYPDGVHQ